MLEMTLECEFTVNSCKSFLIPRGFISVQCFQLIHASSCFADHDLSVSLFLMIAHDFVPASAKIKLIN